MAVGSCCCSRIISCSICMTSKSSSAMSASGYPDSTARVAAGDAYRRFVEEARLAYV